MPHHSIGSTLAPSGRKSYDYLVPGDYTRFSFNPLRWFAGVLEQQGRVGLDRDANETYTLLRRILGFIKQSIDRGLQWAGFEPNDRRLKRRWRP